jgi:hypothetical protein
MSTSRLPHREHTSRSRQSIISISVPVPGCHLDGIGLDLAATPLAPDDQSDGGIGGTTERHRHARLGPDR